MLQHFGLKPGGFIYVSACYYKHAIAAVMHGLGVFGAGGCVGFYYFRYKKNCIWAAG